MSFWDQEEDTVSCQAGLHEARLGNRRTTLTLRSGLEIRNVCFKDLASRFPVNGSIVYTCLPLCVHYFSSKTEPVLSAV